MEKDRKNLKITSIVVLVLAGLTLLELVFELMFGAFNQVEIPEGSPENILLITKIFVFVISLLVMLPQIYIGLKGLIMAKNPNGSSGHIVWAIILLALAVIGLISPITAIIKQESVFENISSLCSIIVEITVFIEYIVYARAVRREN